jgi:hypothetical protein
MRSLEISQAGEHEWQSVRALTRIVCKADTSLSEIYNDRKLTVLANIKQLNQDLDRVIKGCVTISASRGSMV